MKFLFPLILLAALVGISSCESTEPSPNADYFLKFLGNDGDQTGVDFVVNTDGAIIVLGNSRSSSTDDQDLYIAKLNTEAKIIWEVTLGESLDDAARDIELLPDGSLLILANSQVSSTNNDVLVVKLNQDGTEIGRARQGLTESNGITPKNEDAKSISIISDGYIVAGSTSTIPQPVVNKSDFMYMRFMTDLTLANSSWGSTGGFAGEDVAIKVVQGNGTTFYVFGYSNSATAGPSAVADFNFTFFSLGQFGGNGNQNVYLGSTNTDEKMTGFSDATNQPLPGYLLTGTSQNTIDGDIYFVKLKRDLSFSLDPSKPDVIIERPLGLNIGKSALQKSFNDSPSSNTFFVATEKLNGTSLDILLTKLDSRGNKLFEATFGSKEGDDFAGKVMELADGRILMIGTMTMGGVVDGQKKIALIKLNAQGKLAP